MLGGGYVNYFALDGRSYKVIPQVQQASRLNPDQVLDYHIRAADGASVPLVDGGADRHQGDPAVAEPLPAAQHAPPSRAWRLPGVSQGEALQTLQELAARTLPQGYFDRLRRRRRASSCRSSGGFVVTFAFALIIIYLSLAALFESFRDPLIILFSVPMSIAGALVFLMALSTVGLPRRHAQHLHPGRAGHPDGPDQQARHPDRRGRQRAAAGRQVQARGHRGGGRHPPAAHPDDHGGDGAGRRAADRSHRRRRAVALQHGPGDRQRPRRSARCSRCSSCPPST